MFDKDRKQMDQDLQDAINSIDLPDANKHFLKYRWLSQVIWMERRADTAKYRHYILRVTTIIGGVIIPTLASLSAINASATNLSQSLLFPWIVQHAQEITILVGLLIAVSAALEEFFRFGERWRHYRRTVEMLKIEGWKFLQLSDRYSNRDYQEAYPIFAARVEDIIKQDVQIYIELVQAKENKEVKRDPKASTQ